MGINFRKEEIPFPLRMVEDIGLGEIRENLEVIVLDGHFLAI